MGKSNPFSLLLVERVSRIVHSTVKSMGFGDLKSRSGLEALNKYLEDKSYIEG